jgi:hypothetical protein
MTVEDQEWLDEDYAPRLKKFWSARTPGQPILEFLEESCIISALGMTSDKRGIVIEEACDRAFGLTFNKSQLAELIGALRALHGQMQD